MVIYSSFLNQVESCMFNYQAPFACFSTVFDLLMIGQVPDQFYWHKVVVGMSIQELKSIHCSNNFKRLDQAINSDVARALINSPIGKVDQLS